MAVSTTQHLSQQATGVWLRHRTALLMTAIIGLAALLRLYRIDANGLSNDESWSVWVASQSVTGIVRTILFQTVDATPPTYYTLLHLAMRFDTGLFGIRAVSILAGALAVWLTFRFAALLFDLRVATLSAVLLAIAPLHITYSQISRAYMLASLLALLSLYLFARLLLKQGNRWTRVWFVVATAAMLYTFYLMFLVVVFENSVIVVLWLRRRLPRAHLVAWLRSQIVLALAVVPTLLSVAFALTWSHGRSGYGLTWIPRPGLQALIKTAILFITGDPSYGPTGITLMRGLSLLVIMLLGVLGIAVYMRRSARGTADDEGPRILFVAAAAGFPWAAVFIVSQARPIYNEKYLLFVIPLLAILIAWIIIRARSVLLAGGIMLALLGLTITALGVYYTEPDGEQWREATGYVRSAYQPGDLIIISPGFYGRPFTYYFAGSFPDNIHALDHVAAITDANGIVQAFDAAHAGGSATARRIWLVSGYAPVDSATSAWTQRSFRARDQQDFVGVHVQLLERAGP